MRNELIPNMPERVYLADPCDEPSLNPSTAKELVGGSARKAYRHHPKLGGKMRAPKAEFDRGKLVHELLLGVGGGYTVCPVEYDEKKHKRTGKVTDYKTDAAKKWRDETQAKGGVPVLEAELGAVQYAVNAIRGRMAEDFSIALTGMSEVTALWEDHGVQCRTRLDHLVFHHGRAEIFELKHTSESAHPNACRKRVESYGYDIAAAAQIRAVERIMPEMAGRVELTWIFVELDPPYDVTACGPSGEMLEIGAMLWHRGAERWKECLARDNWPGYVEHRRILEPSGYRLRELEDYNPPGDTEPAPPSPREDSDDAELRAMF